MTTAQRQEGVEIACQQVLLRDASVYSIQWLVLPLHPGQGLRPGRLLELYLDHVRRSTFGLVRPRAGSDGIEFRLLASRSSLLSFDRPILADSRDGNTTTLRIRGGILVQRRQRHRGELVFRAEPADSGIKVTLVLSDYCPLLLGGPRPSYRRKLLYRLTQAFIHKVVTVGFLTRLYRETTGETGRFRVVPVRVKEGERT